MVVINIQAGAKSKSNHGVDMCGIASRTMNHYELVAMPPYGNKSVYLY